MLVCPVEVTPPLAMLAPSTPLATGAAVIVLPGAPVVVTAPATSDGTPGGVGVPKLICRPFPSIKTLPVVLVSCVQPAGGTHLLVARS